MSWLRVEPPAAGGLLRFGAGLAIAAALAFALSGCGGGSAVVPQPGDGAPSKPIDVSRVPDAVPKPEPRSRYGNPSSYRVYGKEYRTLASADGYRERGIASWYGTKFHGRLTSSREPYDMYVMSAAHRSLPLPTFARVTNLDNGRSVVLRINDRGPFHPNRIIDLSYAAAARLDILAKGTGLVEVTAIDPTRPEPAPPPEPLQDSPEAPPPAAHRMFLQVGAFGSRDNAERLLARLKSDLKADLRIQSLQRRRQSLFRVQVGPLASVGQVDAMTQRLQKLGIDSSHVIVD